MSKQNEFLLHVMIWWGIALAGNNKVGIVLLPVEENAASMERKICSNFSYFHVHKVYRLLTAEPSAGCQDTWRQLNTIETVV